LKTVNSLDTNVLVYAVSAGDSARERAARKLLRRATLAGWPISAQVYAEFYAVMIRRQMMGRQEARAAIEAFSALMPPMPSTLTAHAAALALATEKQVQIWDALIIAVCAENGITQLLTEDTPSAAKLLGVKCVSPFARN
jgi:predicted nucleic acid-binding protein